MKKVLFFAALAAAVMTACSSDEMLEQQTIEVQSPAISFRTVANNGTRATIMDSENIKDFQVSAVYADWNAVTAADAPATLMDNVVVVRNVGSSAVTVGNFTYAPIKYFPVDGEAVDFYAFSPAGSRNLVSITPANGLETDGTTITGTSSMALAYTVPLNDPISEGTTKSQEDFMVASNLQNTGTSTDVVMAFDHALSKVTFAAKNLIANTTVNISAIRLVNLGNEATLTLSYTRGTPVTPSLVWGTPAAKDLAYVASVPTTGFTLIGAAGASYSNLTTVNEGLMVLPQTLNIFDNGATFDPAIGKDPYVEITYGMNDATGQALYPAGTIAQFPLSAVSKVASPFYDSVNNPDNKLLYGHSYNLQFTFGGDTDGDGDIDDEDNGPGSVSEIDFSVSVNAWNGSDEPLFVN